MKGIWEDVSKEDVSNTGGRPDLVSCPADAGVEQVESDEDEDAYYDDDDDESNEWWLDTDHDGVEQAIERRTGERGNITNIFSQRCLLCNLSMMPLISHTSFSHSLHSHNRSMCYSLF